MGLDSEIVYIVDDDPIVRDALSSLLRANGKMFDCSHPERNS
jgi:FixJ family two-component response regulator